MLNFENLDEKFVRVSGRRYRNLENNYSISGK